MKPGNHTDGDAAATPENISVWQAAALPQRQQQRLDAVLLLHAELVV